MSEKGGMRWAGAKGEAGRQKHLRLARARKIMKAGAKASGVLPF